MRCFDCRRHVCSAHESVQTEEGATGLLSPPSLWQCGVTRILRRGYIILCHYFIFFHTQMPQRTYNLHFFLTGDIPPCPPLVTPLLPRIRGVARILHWGQHLSADGGLGEDVPFPTDYTGSGGAL